MLTRAAFRAWLEMKEPDETVGEAWAENACPLATYIGGNVLVYSSDYDVSGALFTLPTWAKEFVQEVDKWGKGREITSKMALEILEGVDDEAQ